MAKLVDATDLKFVAEKHAGSTPAGATSKTAERYNMIAYTFSKQVKIRYCHEGTPADADCFTVNPGETVYLNANYSVELSLPKQVELSATPSKARQPWQDGLKNLPNKRKKFRF